MSEEITKSLGSLILEDSDLAHKLFTAPLVPKQSVITGAVPQVQEQSKPVVEAEGRMAQELDSNERNRPKKLDSIVAKAEKAASSGHWLARYRGIAEAAGKAKLARVFSHLQDIFDIAGHMPSGLQTLADEMADTLGYRLVQDGWTRKDLERIAWGLPLDFLDSAGVERPSGGRAEKENR